MYVERTLRFGLGYVGIIFFAGGTVGLEETRIRQTSRKGIIKVNSPSSEHESRSGFSSLSSRNL
jgi:hypothetical protein